MKSSKPKIKVSKSKSFRHKNTQLNNLNYDHSPNSENNIYEGLNDSTGIYKDLYLEYKETICAVEPVGPWGDEKVNQNTSFRINDISSNDIRTNSIFRPE